MKFCTKFWTKFCTKFWTKFCRKFWTKFCTKFWTKFLTKFCSKFWTNSLTKFCTKFRMKFWTKFPDEISGRVFLNLIELNHSSIAVPVRETGKTKLSRYSTWFDCSIIWVCTFILIVCIITHTVTMKTFQCWKWRSIRVQRTGYNEQTEGEIPEWGIIQLRIWGNHILLVKYPDTIARMPLSLKNDTRNCIFRDENR